MAPKTVSVRVPENELAVWTGHAQTLGIPVGEWVYRAVRVVLDTDLPGTTTITGRPKRLLAMVRACLWCGRKLGRDATPRRQYCSEVCRVRAWRARRSLATR